MNIKSNIIESKKKIVVSQTIKVFFRIC